MNYIDIFLIVVLVLGAIKGYLKGLVVEIFSFLAFFVGLFLAIELTIPVAERFFSGNDYFQLFTVGVFVALFLVAVLIVNLLAKLLKKALDLTFLGFFDNVLGALAGIFKWAFIVSVFFWVFDSIGVRFPDKQTDGSLIYPYVKELGPKAFEWLSKVLPFIEDMMDSLKNIGDKHRSLYTFL
ncbi:CvpA family protein [Marinoscillum furvescens]|uniref:Membrane protein required for colicin V production n=1 Tax=Marinoscillum furvescens DSM 4134 TaxID=1122208 RepID=A0A3D9L683_MARFU|nr:CvpA family protein [Marinoscillum furvescens]REE01677.1 membrane protein required for colicin V production [Marinoscillum furvescens DSM 4134]